MPTFSSMKQLEDYLNAQAKKAMMTGKNVQNVVIETGKKHVQEDVYDVYTPAVYERTGKLKEDWEVKEIANGIEIGNTRSENGKDIVDTIEYGRNYDYEFEYSDTPRPFIENTREELRNSNELLEALKKDMKSIGLDVK